MGAETQPGETGTTPVEQSDSSPSELAGAAKGMAEIADQVKALRESLRSLREGMAARATAPADGDGELHEVASQLEESAEHLSRAVELVTPAVAAGSTPESEPELPDGLRALIGSLRVAGWSDEQVAGYLRRELDVPDASAAVARAWDPSH